MTKNPKPRLTHALEIARVGAALGIAVGYALLFAGRWMDAGYVAFAAAVLFAGCSLAMAVIEWKGDRWRVSLQTALIVTTVAAVVLGILVATVRLK